MSDCRWPIEFGKRCRRSDTTFRARRSPLSRRPRSDRRGVLPRNFVQPHLNFYDGRRELWASGRHHRRRTHARSTRPIARILAPLLSAPASGRPDLKRGAHRRLRIDRLSGRDRRVCVPVLEQHSGLQWKQDFIVGYSPERINPGDKQHTLTRSSRSSPAIRRNARPVARALRRRGEAPASIAQLASAWPRPPRSSRTRSAI